MSTSLALVPGTVVSVRDEDWVVTSARKINNPPSTLIHVRGLSELVRDTTASFYSHLDKIEALTPESARIVADPSPRYRRSRLFLETTLRKTPEPATSSRLTVSPRMLARELKYQQHAVRKALDPGNVRPRLLIADAVGLGKTLEIGMILSELVARGRGENILIVTPRHVLEQMQHELWCRFALPFVRLDSTGIARIRQTIPASRNPFTIFNRVIISIDTLKSARYREHLRRRQWDAVVIDESHNLTNAGTQNNELARLLAPQTDALILASATPHNGKTESFAELVRLLDPTLVSPSGEIDFEAAKRLIVRRHRYSPDVASEVGADWAERAEPRHIMVTPSPAEEAIAAELESVWLYPSRGEQGVLLDDAAPAAPGMLPDVPPATPGNATLPAATADSAPLPAKGRDRLFAWGLAKAFLSSPAALAETVQNRLSSPKLLPAEREPLERLAKLAAQAASENAGKFGALVAHLKSIGVGKGSVHRAVVFAERVATLNDLHARLPKALGLKPDAVALLHGGLSDVEQQAVVEDFKRGSSAVRVLVTGDVASEGVNLHTECHDLIHFDIPWSLIRIEQRNGRIDRFGQKNSPQIVTLLLSPRGERFSGDIRVLSRLVEKEHEAHKALGDAASLMGKHSVKAEEDAILDCLVRSGDLDSVAPSPAADSLADLDALLASLGAETTFSPAASGSAPAPGTAAAHPTGEPYVSHGLFDSDVDYLQEALFEAFEDPGQKVGWEWDRSKRVAKLDTSRPACRDLVARLSKTLPQEYLRHRRVLESLTLATDAHTANLSLTAARRDEESNWPGLHYLSPLHPVLDWAADRALQELSRNEVLAVRGEVDEPTFLFLGAIANGRGQLLTRTFIEADSLFPSTVDSLPEFLARVGLADNPINPGPVSVESLQPLLPGAVELARRELDSWRSLVDTSATSELQAWIARSGKWLEAMSLMPDRRQMRERRSRVEAEQALANQMLPASAQVVPLLVVVPRDWPAAEGEL